MILELMPASVLVNFQVLWLYLSFLAFLLSYLHYIIRDSAYGRIKLLIRNKF